MSINKKIILFLVLILVVVGIFVLEKKKVKIVNPVDDAASNIDIVVNKPAEERISLKKTKFELAKEITSPDGFINTNNISISEFIGKKVVLLDIWTYSCINCQRTLPHLNSWYEKYEDDGLVIIGLHTPEFEFEKDYDNVKKAVEKFGVKYPVVLDNDYSTWQAYKNQYWPRKYLIDIDGFVAYDHIGEGAYDITEEKIVELLNERKQLLGDGSAISVDTRSPEGIEETIFGEVKTPEIYLGYQRLQYLANLPSNDCADKICSYELPEGINPNTFLLLGDWLLGSESADLENGSGSIFINFSAGKVNLVAGSEGGARAEIFLDGKLIDNAVAGEAVENGEVIFRDHSLYNLVDLGNDYGEHVLEIRISEPDFAGFAFTFG